MKLGSGLSTAFRTPCCFIVLNAKHFPAKGYTDRTCPLCMAVWRFTMQPDGSLTNERLAGQGDAYSQRIMGIKHGTRDGYDKYRCRCADCRRAKETHQAGVMERARAKRPPGLGVHRFCGPCRRGQPHFLTPQDKDRNWTWARRHGYDWVAYQKAIMAVLKAIQAHGRTYRPPAPPVDFRKLGLLAKRERAVIYVVDNRCTLRRPQHGPFVEVWPSGLVSFVGGPEGHTRAA